MYAVGRLGSYISRGVYTVSGPFHPFGGAVDIVVVEQQDGSFKSSPWYVRFGKFQGVLKAKEKIVDINVNGEDVSFHMYLDQRGEAYFLTEVDREDVDTILSPPSGEETDVRNPDKRPLKSRSLNYYYDHDSVTHIDVSNDGKVLSKTNSQRSTIMGFVLGRRSMKKDEAFRVDEDGSGVVRANSLERAEIAADLLEMKWSTNISNMKRKEDESRLSSAEISNGEASSDCNKDLNSQSREVNDQCASVDCKENAEASVVSPAKMHDEQVGCHESDNSPLEGCSPKRESSGIESSGPNEKVSESISFSCEKDAEVDVRANNSDGTAKMASEVNLPPVTIEESMDTDGVIRDDERFDFFEPPPEYQKVVDDLTPTKEAAEGLEEEQFLFSDLDNDKLAEIERRESMAAGHSGKDDQPSCSTDKSNTSSRKFVRESLTVDIKESNPSRRRSSCIDIPIISQSAGQKGGRVAHSLPNMWSPFDEFGANHFHDSVAHSFESKSLSSKWELLRKDVSRIVKTDMERECPLSTSEPLVADPHISKELKDVPDNHENGDQSNTIDASGGSWGLWPFKRSRSRKYPPPPPSLKKVSDFNGHVNEEEVSSPLKLNKMKIRVLTPTSEQLKSLNLKEGRNTVTFTFSTAMLGAQQVDARIYLWRWDTRIVISDVDGTITKSDVLGQFMPLVGRDWSQTGVAHLFSAIKENGYQLLFLSARAISQAYLTRQFLFNLKQDGKALPDGPVVISPDGLFPSLFREVIRRAPHEFKISCLEDIKALFPSERNPFYAGFGNRDTDEFSYLKVGIPKGKIFIINPKGEVFVNRCVNSKSYTSLHALVNGMFPPTPAHEEEDYNSWNFWKLPPPSLDM